MPTVRTPEAPCRRSPSRDPRCCLPLWEMGSATPTTIDFGAIFPFTCVPAYSFPVYASQRPLPDATQDSVRGCWLGFAAVAISGACASRAFKAQPPQIRSVRVLPHPAPRQMASLRAVAYPLVQKAGRWPPPSLRLVWPVRLSVVVTWRRGPNLGVLAVCPSTGATCRCPLPSTGSRGLNSPASAVSGRRRRPSKGSPPSAAQTVRAVFPHTAFTRLPGGREMEGINEWTFCSPVGLSQSASLLGRSLLGLSHKELIRAIGLTNSRPAVSPTTLPTDFPSPPGCRSRGRTAFTARQVLFGRPTPRTTSPSTSPSDL